MAIRKATGYEVILMERKNLLKENLFNSNKKVGIRIYEITHYLLFTLSSSEEEQKN
jgi:hypothetical protein